MDRFFRIDSPLMNFLNRLGQIIIVDLIWLLCCIPVVTIIPATTSMYYAMTKSIRHGRGYPVKEFFRSMKRTLLSGSLLTAGLLLWGWLWYTNRESVAGRFDGGAIWMALAYDVLAVLTLLVLLYLIPVYSRFAFGMGRILGMSFVMGLRYFPVTMLLACGCAVCAALIRLLPLPGLLVFPGVWCYLSSYPVDQVLLKYTPKPVEGEDAWYYPQKAGREKREEGKETRRNA